MSIRKEILKLEDLVDKSKDKYFEKIINKSLKAVREYSNNFNIKLWDKAYKKIEDLFYESLTETYLITSKYIEKLYEEVEEFNIKNIFDLTYKEDGKTIQDRLSLIWKETRQDILEEKTYKEIRDNLVYKFERILNTETKNVENAVKKNKKPINATLLVIESGCDMCEGGEYPPDEDVDLPPYHPSCRCIFYYEVADPDDVHDLDLEEEE